LAEILFNPYTVRQIELINSQLSYLTHIIKDRDRDEMDKFLGKLRTNIGMTSIGTIDSRGNTSGQ